MNNIIISKQIDQKQKERRSKLTSIEREEDNWRRLLGKIKVLKSLYNFS